MATQISEEDEGKKVVFGDETVGRIVEVEHGVGYVDPDAGMFETMKAKLGWGDASEDEDAYPLQEASIERITDDAVELRTDL